MVIPNYISADADHSIPTDSLSLAVLPLFLGYLADNGNTVALSVEDDYQFWQELYKSVVPTEFLANFGAALTALLDGFLKFDQFRGLISDEQSAAVFGLWQELILCAMVRCEERTSRPNKRNSATFPMATTHQAILDYLDSFAEGQISCCDWPAVQNELQTMLCKLLPIPYNNPRKLGIRALNARLCTLGIPRQIMQTCEGYYITAEEDIA